MAIPENNSWRGNGILSKRQKVTIESYMRQHLYTFMLCVAAMAMLFCGVLIGETSKISPILHQINDNLTILAIEQKSLAERQKRDYSIQYSIHSRLYFRIDSIGEELKLLRDYVEK